VLTRQDDPQLMEQDSNYWKSCETIDRRAPSGQWEFPGSALWIRHKYFQIQNLFQLFSGPDPGQKLAAKGFLSEHKTVRKPAEYSLKFSNNMLHGFDHFYILVAIHFTIIHQKV
jgi:hypothetical protein